MWGISGLVKAIRDVVGGGLPVEIITEGASYQQEVMADEPQFLYIADTATLTRLSYNNATATADGTNNGTASADTYVAPPLINQGMYSTLGSMFFDCTATVGRPTITVPWFAGRENTTSMTFECLFNTATRDNVTLYASHLAPGAGNGWRVGVDNSIVNDGIFSLRYWNSSTEYSVLAQPSIDIPTNEVVHLAITIDNSSSTGAVVFYMNGVEFSTEALQSAVIPLNDQEDGYIGGLRTTGGIEGRDGFYFNGSISHVAQYDRILSSSDVLRHYDAITLNLEDYTPNTEYYADLITADSPNLSINFNSPEQGSATAGVTDTSGNGNNGTIFGEVQRGNLGLSSAGTAMALIPNATTHAGVKIPYNVTMSPNGQDITMVGSVVRLTDTADAPNNTGVNVYILSLGDSGFITSNYFSCSLLIRKDRMAFIKYVSGSSTETVNSDTYASLALDDSEIGALHHYAVTVQNTAGGTVTFYRDGEQIGTTKSITTALTNQSTSASSYVGASTDLSAENFGSYGIIDNVALFRGTLLTPERIKAYASTTSALQVSSLDDYSARWSMDDIGLVPITQPQEDTIINWETNSNPTHNTVDFSFGLSPVNAISYETGVTGSAVLLESVNRELVRVSTGASDLHLQTITFQTDVRIKSTGATQYIYSNSADTNYFGLWLYFLTDNRVRFLAGYGTGSNEFIGSTALSINTWYRITAVRTPTRMELYVDGVLVDSLTPTTGTVDYTGCQSALGARYDVALGVSNDASYRDFLDGNLDNTKFWDTALTAEEIAEQATGAPNHSLTAGLDGVLKNTPTRVIGYDALTDGALSFNGVDQYVSFPDTASLKPTGSFTATAWIKVPDGGSGFIMQIGNQRVTTNEVSGFVFYVGETNSELRFRVGDNATIFGTGWNEMLSDIPVDDDQWHHVAVVHDDGVDMKIYLDGVNTDTDAWVNGITYDTTTYLELGRRFTDFASQNDNYFDGDMDDVRLYDKALSTAEILYLAKTTIPPKPQDMIAEWKFESDATDNVGTNDLTQVGTPTYTAGWEGNALTIIGGVQSAGLSNANSAPFQIQEFSVSFFVKIEDPTNLAQGIVSSYYRDVAGVTRHGWTIVCLSAGYFLYAEYNNSETSSITNRVDDTFLRRADEGRWQHVCVARDATNFTMYVDGEIAITGDTGYSLSYTNGEFNVGTQASSTGNLNDFQDGQIDELRFYDRKLTAEEVKAIALRDAPDFTEGVTPPPPPSYDPLGMTLSTNDITATVPSGLYNSPTVTANVTDGSGNVTYEWSVVSTGTPTPAQVPVLFIIDDFDSQSTFFYNSYSGVSVTGYTLRCTVTDLGTDEVVTDDVVLNITWESIIETPPAGLVMHHTFDDVAGTISQDETANNNDATFQQAITTEAGQVDNAVIVYENPAFQYASVVDDALLKPTEFTFAGYIKPDATAGNQGGIFQSYNADFGSAGGHSGSLAYDSGQNQFSFRALVADGIGNVVNTNVFSAVADIDAGTWTHVAYTYDGTDIKIYVDGTLVTTVNAGITVGYKATNYVGMFALQTDFAPVSTIPVGSYDDFRYYNFALTQPEIQELVVVQPTLTTANSPKNSAFFVDPIVVSPLAINTTASGGSGDYSYLWERISGNTWSIISGGTSSSVDLEGYSSAGETTDVFRVTVTDNVSGLTATDTTTIVVNWGTV